MDDPRRKAEQAGSFGRAAQTYERARPEFPTTAVEWLVPGEARRVLDLGAGTGKLTRGLAARGFELTAVDPSPEMLAELSARLPEVETLVGTAEEIPLEDGSVDAVTVAQAWHWVDEERALAEVARVLRPGGTLGLAWNERDDRIGWVERLSTAMHRTGSELSVDAPVEIGLPFGPTETLEVEWRQVMDLELLLEMTLSRSYLITAPQSEREAILAAVRAVIEAEVAPDGGEFELPYRTLCSRAAIGTSA